MKSKGLKRLRLIDGYLESVYDITNGAKRSGCESDEAENEDCHILRDDKKGGLPRIRHSSDCREPRRCGGIVRPLVQPSSYPIVRVSVNILTQCHF